MNKNMLVVGLVVLLILLGSAFIMQVQTKNATVPGEQARKDNARMERDDDEEEDEIKELEEDGDETGKASTASVEIKNFAFSPKKLEVAPGTKVTFTNQDNVGHTATAQDGSFDTGLLAKGQSATVTFDTDGTFEYYCKPHPNMKAEIEVEK